MKDLPYAEVLENLRVTRRLNGKASETIGRLRAEIARLRLERAEWRGTVNGDVLVEVLAASAPEQWTPEDRRAHAERVLEAMQASGIEVRRAARHWAPVPGGLAVVPRRGGPKGAGMLVRVREVTGRGNVSWVSFDGRACGVSAPGELEQPAESYVEVQ
ncbi:hypothetical protein [Amycolatopsis sp. cmx-4-83]|uniref:hypothetical protein n=1 Tax=Amycolatopsis sp. cmx-4-83 TaxID=2790940 RepID=UPI00397B86D4